MTDVVEWLRNQQTLFDLAKSKDRMPEKAADEIERLRAALKNIVDMDDNPDEPVPYSWGLTYFKDAHKIARAALKGSEG